MVSFRAIKFNKLSDFKAIESQIISYVGNIAEWGCKKGTDGTVLCVLDERLNDFNWGNLIIQTFNTTNLIYFPKPTFPI